MKTLTRHTKFFPAYDKSSKDPSKNYGIHGVNLLFWVAGEEGALSVTIFTNWQLPEVEVELIGKCGPYYCYGSPRSADVSFHSSKKLDSEYAMYQPECLCLENKECWVEYSSSLDAQEYFDVLRREGSDALWLLMESRYHELKPSVRT